MSMVVTDVWKESIATFIVNQSKNKLHILKLLDPEKKAAATISGEVGGNWRHIPDDLKILLLLSLVKCKDNDGMSTL